MNIEANFFQNKVNQSVRSSVKWVQKQILKEDGPIIEGITADIHSKLKMILEEAGLGIIADLLIVEQDLISIDSKQIDFEKLPKKNMVYRFFSSLPQDLQNDHLFDHVYNSPYTADQAPDLYGEKYGIYTGIWVPSSVSHHHNMRLESRNIPGKYHKIDFKQGRFVFSLPLTIMFLYEGAENLSPESIKALGSISAFFPKKELIEAFWN